MLKRAALLVAGLALLGPLALACTTPTEAPPVSGQTAAPGTTPVSFSLPPVTTTSQPEAQITGSVSTVDLVRKLRPSVVHVQTELAPQDFFSQASPGQGVGTGSIIDNQGYILTNAHVVEGASRITVGLDDDRTFTARLVGTDPFTDLAVIKIDAANLTPITLGDSKKVQVGEDVVAIGFALDLEGGPSVTKGVVSAVGRSVAEDAQITLDDLIQTDASINPGNSGGPLVNSRGEQIGVNTVVAGNAQGIGFAISVNQARSILEELIASGRITRSYLGIRLATVTPSIAQANNLGVERGVAVLSIEPTAPAGKAGLAARDIIVSLNGKAVTNSAQLLNALRENRPGTVVAIEYFRGSQKRSVDVTLGQRPATALLENQPTRA